MGRIRSVAVAVGPRGDVLVAWDAARDDPRALQGRRPAAASSPSRRSRRTRPSSPRCRPRSPTAGAATWPGARSCSPRAAPAGRSSTRSPCGRRATASAPPSSSSAMARTAARRRSRSPLTGSRDASVAWTGFDGANSRVRVASTDPVGALRRAAGRLARRPRRGGLRSRGRGSGIRLVVWDNGSFDANQVFAALAPPGAPFAAARGRLRAPRRHAPGTAIMVPAPTVVWTNRPAGSHPPGGLAAVQTFAQAATRTG